MSLHGLSDIEVAAQRVKGLGNTMPMQVSRSYVQIVRENVFNSLNSMLFLLGIALVLLGRVSDALVAVGVVLVNVLVSVVQVHASMQGFAEGPHAGSTASHRVEYQTEVLIDTREHPCWRKGEVL